MNNTLIQTDRFTLSETERSAIEHELHHYEAENGFFNPTRAAWSPEHAEKAWARTLQFLGSALA